MNRLVALNILLYVAALLLFLEGLGIAALICFVVAALLSLGLSGGKIDSFDLFD